MPSNIQVLADPAFQTELPSGARSATYVGIDKTNVEAARGVYVVLDLTSFVTAASLTVFIEVLDPNSGKYIDMIGAVAVTANSTSIYIVAPNAVTGAPVTKGVSAWLTQKWRIRVVHGNANSHTYSVSFAYLG